MLTTDRLVLRPFQEGDIDAMAKLLGDALAMGYVGDGGPLDKERAATRVRKARESFARDGTGALAVVLASTGEFIGYCGIEIGEDTGELELNYGLLPAWWGRGLALEAATAVVSWADGFCETLFATADPENSASLSILGRLGFEPIQRGPDVHGLETVFFKRARPLRSPDAC